MTCRFGEKPLKWNQGAATRLLAGQRSPDLPAVGCPHSAPAGAHAPAILSVELSSHLTAMAALLRPIYHLGGSLIPNQQRQVWVFITKHISRGRLLADEQYGVWGGWWAPVASGQGCPVRGHEEPRGGALREVG